MNEPLTAKHCGVCGAIEDRLERLERGVKRGKRAPTATMVLLVLLIAWSVAARNGKARAAGSGARDLVARSLTIVDDKRTQRVVVKITKDGPSVRLSDEKGKLRFDLRVTKDVPRMLLLTRGKPNASFWRSSRTPPAWSSRTRTDARAPL